MERLRFLDEKQVRRVREAHGTPTYVYHRPTLERRAGEMLAFPNAFGLTVRYAMKALPTAAVLRCFHDLGLHIDASSGYEAERAMRAGIPPEHIQLTTQQLPANLAALVSKGVLFSACSLHQLEAYAAAFPQTEVCVRVNPGLGSGHSNRTNVGGPSSSFGVWHEHLDTALAIARRYGLRLTRMHTHIGSGADPKVWVRCARLSLDIAARLPDVTRLSLGGGFKVARMAHEKTSGIQEIGAEIRPEFKAFAQQHGRELHLEVEPGTYLTANAGAVVCAITDIVNTGPNGNVFIKVDSGMTEVARAAMYGAQHPLVVVPATAEERGTETYLVSGHCCESGDTLTPQDDDPEGLKPRELTEARIGDLLVIEGAGAYCAAQACKNYNSFPEAPELMLAEDGEFHLIRERQTLEQMVRNEILD